MTLSTFFGFFIGRRDAIQCIVATPAAIWLGLVFVLSAGFAREYDGEDLLREPWHVLIPVGASLATSLGLYCLVRLINPPANFVGSFWEDYRSFLSLYWMTAPLAWLYAIPVERFSTAADAVRYNLMLLGIVSLWRVLLMVRVFQVAFAVPKAVALFIVMLFADGVAMAVLWFTPLPIFNIMGGIRMTESEQLIRDTATLVAVLGVLAFPVWLIGLGISLAVAHSRSKSAAASSSPGVLTSDVLSRHGTINGKLWALAAASILIWGVVLPLTQPEQQLRYDVEEALRDSRIKDALHVMSQHNLSDFPPHWDPPPRPGYGDNNPWLYDVLSTTNEQETAPWVLNVYFEKLQRYARRNYYAEYLLRNSRGEVSTNWLEFLGQSRRGLDFVRENSKYFSELAESEQEHGSKNIATQIRELMQKAEQTN